MALDKNRLLELLGNSSGRFAEARTHRTYAVENELPFDNQRLEFLGDAVLEIILSDYLIARYPEADEGELSRMRAVLACESTFAGLARSLELSSIVQIGRGEASAGGADRDSILADLFEAVAGACYLELGFETTRRFFLDLFAATYPEPRRLLAETNPKGLLQEYAQSRRGATPRYTVLRIAGPQHLPTYEVESRLFGVVALGRGRSRKLAEMDAARRLYQYFSGRRDHEVSN